MDLINWTLNAIDPIFSTRSLGSWPSCPAGTFAAGYVMDVGEVACRYEDVGSLRYFYFMIAAMLYVVIVIVNTSLLVVICVNRSLHEPMYIFLCSLFVNELYGSTGLFPFLLVQILSDIHTVSVSLCFLQIYCLYTYGSIEFCNLAVMSYDRYLAICCPLQYNTRMTCNKAVIFIIAVWLYSFVSVLIPFSLNIRLTLCGNIMNSLCCHNYLVAELACSDIKVNNIYGLFSTAVSLLVPLLSILISYGKILKVCFSGSKQTRQKAASTCIPHLASLLNFSFGCSFQILQSRFDMSSVPSVLRIILSLYFLIMPPFLNPFMFGLQMSKIWNKCKHILFHKMLARRKIK
ncbi:olfactory receptor 52D1-like [Centropristis striata]|uniref:olfactory receptor 52D1-like n=1 Tax=Centropristis striata TaxID=184440 RepID=UPI0027E16BC4|nr:olfactory receptor 52D1-like [Centropristis striata]